MPAKIEVRSEAQDAAAHRVSTPTTRVAIFRGDTAKQQELAALYNDPQKSFFLFGSKLKYTPDGRILFKRYHPSTGERFLTAKDEGKRPKDKRATPGSPRSRFQRIGQEVYIEVADVETAIRLVDHIKRGTHGKEASQAKAVADRAQFLLQKFGEKWGRLTRKELDKIIKETDAMLAKEKLDPQRVGDYYKSKMTQPLVKGSTIYDRTGRPNYSAVIKRLSQAYDAAMARGQQLARIHVKYEGAMQTALRKEREIARRILENVAHYADPKVGILTSALFKFTSWADRKYQARTVALLLARMESQMLENIHMNSYRKVAIEAAAELAYARTFIEFISSDHKTEYYRFDAILHTLKTSTFPRVYQLLSDELERTKDVYPPGKRRGGLVYIS